MDVIFMPTTDDAYGYSLSFIEKGLIDRLRQIVFIHNDTNSSLHKKNSNLYEAILEKQSDKICRRKYLSSALTSLHEKSSKKGGTLSLVSTGVNSFNDKNLNHLGLLSQDNFEQDLRFAISNDLLTKDLSSFISDPLSDSYHKKLSRDNGVCEFYDKRFSRDAYNLNTPTNDEEIVVMRFLDEITKNKNQITVLDYGCGDGRLFTVFNKFLTLNPSSHIKLFACDISIEGLKKYQNNLLAQNFEILESENRDQKCEYDCFSVLRSAKKNLEVILVRAKPNHYEDVKSIGKCDLSISIAVLQHILDRKNRGKFYDFLRFISKNSFFTASKHNFLSQLEHFSKLREKKSIL
ncbi:MAG: hypothetical protein EBU93_07600, partial [Chlamydiae bacterium]|nr:hypothetical protein [Chlamydiota bacterium]